MQDLVRSLLGALQAWQLLDPKLHTATQKDERNCFPVPIQETQSGSFASFRAHELYDRKVTSKHSSCEASDPETPKPWRARDTKPETRDPTSRSRLDLISVMRPAENSTSQQILMVIKLRLRICNHNAAYVINQQTAQKATVPCTNKLDGTLSARQGDQRFASDTVPSQSC